MKRVAAAICFAVVIAAVYLGNPSRAAGPSLSGKMSHLQYLVGTWNCKTRIAATTGMPSHAHEASVSFEMEPGNTISFDVSAPLYAASGFLGYAGDRKLWWSSGSDSFGGVTLESGPSDTGNVSVLKGVTYYSTQRVPSRDTITKASDTKYEDLYETLSGGKWSMGADSVCTKTSNTPG